jgi:hypothetical protein
VRTQFAHRRRVLSKVCRSKDQGKRVHRWK